MNEKPGVQAIGTTAEDRPPILDTDKFSTIWRDYEYVRFGTLSLLAAIDLLTGEAIPLVSPVFTPAHGSWLNMVEGFFSKMTKQMLNGIRVSGKEELEGRIYKYFEEINEVPVPYHWTYNLDDIDLEKEDLSQIVYEVVNHKAALAEDKEKRAPKPKVRRNYKQEAELH